MEDTTNTTKPAPTVSPFGSGPGSNPAYEANLAKSTKARGCTTVVCCYCGRYTGHGKRFAYLANVGVFITPEEGNGMDDLGMYPVGSECAKLLKKNGVKLYT